MRFLRLPTSEDYRIEPENDGLVQMICFSPGVELLRFHLNLLGCNLPGWLSDFCAQKIGWSMLKTALVTVVEGLPFLSRTSKEWNP